MLVELNTLDEVFGITISLSRGFISSKTSASTESYAQKIPEIL